MRLTGRCAVLLVAHLTWSTSSLASAATTQPAATQPLTTVVLRRDYASRGTLVVTMREEAADGGRHIEYAARLIPRDGGKPHELGISDFSDPTPFGSGAPLEELVDLELTNESAVVWVYHAHAQDEDKSIGTYSAMVFTPSDAPIEVPGAGYQTLFYTPGGKDPRTVSVTGSLKDRDLTVNLKGTKDTLRFRFGMYGEGELGLGWHSMKGNHPSTQPLYIAPD